MYPDLFGIKDFSYIFMIIIGLIAAFTLLFIYGRKYILNKAYRYTVEIGLCLSIVVGFAGAFGVQKLLDLIKHETEREFPMTFYGGLIFGILCFLLFFFLYIRKKYRKDASINQLFCICPPCISLAHAFGRIGCFMAGCCYGIETDSWLGMVFPGLGKRYPTQLFEAIFLFILSAVLIFLAFKYHTKYNLSIYLISYAIFRFFIEFIRGDDRGAYFLNLSPAQWISIFLLLGGIGLIIFYQIQKKKHKTLKMS